MEICGYCGETKKYVSNATSVWTGTYCEDCLRLCRKDCLEAIKDIEEQRKLLNL
jgi:hypothetical protein